MQENSGTISKGSFSAATLFYGTRKINRMEKDCVVHINKINKVPFVLSISIGKCNITCVLLNIILHMFFKNARQCQMWDFFNQILHMVY